MKALLLKHLAKSIQNAEYCLHFDSEGCFDLIDQDDVVKDMAMKFYLRAITDCELDDIYGELSVTEQKLIDMEYGTLRIFLVATQSYAPFGTKELYEQVYLVIENRLRESLADVIPRMVQESGVDAYVDHLMNQFKEDAA